MAILKRFILCVLLFLKFIYASEAYVKFSYHAIAKFQGFNPFLKALISGPEYGFGNYLMFKYADKSFTEKDFEDLINQELDLLIEQNPEKASIIISSNVIMKFPLLVRYKNLFNVELKYKRQDLDDLGFSDYMDKMALNSFNLSLHMLFLGSDKYFASELIQLFNEARKHFPNLTPFVFAITDISDNLSDLIPDIFEMCSYRIRNFADHLNCYAEQIYKVLRPDAVLADAPDGGLNESLLELVCDAVYSNPVAIYPTSNRFHSALKFLNFKLLQNNTTRFNYNWEVLSGEEKYVNPSVLTPKNHRFGPLWFCTKVHQNNSNSKVTEIFDVCSLRRYVVKEFIRKLDFKREKDFVSRVDHPYFIKCYGISCSKIEFKSLVYEPIDGRSHTFAENATLEQLQLISAELFLALEYMHSLGFVHGDVKPDNVLIDNKGHVKLIDFGFTFEPPINAHFFGSVQTLSPELTESVEGEINEATDWWAYGNTVGTWHNIKFKEKDYLRCHAPIYYYYSRYISGTISKMFSPELRNFLAIFFQANPSSRRLNTPRLLQKIRDDPFFAGIKWDQLEGGILNIPCSNPSASENNMMNIQE